MGADLSPRFLQLLVHKLEYFRIIGRSVSAAIWELLTAMLVMAGLVGLTVPGGAAEKV